MKKIILVVLAGILFSCNSNSYKVSGEIKGISDGTKVFLEKRDSLKGIVTIDTVKIKNGVFNFEGETNEPEIHNIRIDNLKGGFVIVLENGNIKAEINKDSISKAKITGTYNNDELQKFNNQISKIQTKIMDFQNKNRALIVEAQQKNDTASLKKFQKEFSKFGDEFKIVNESYVEKSPKSFLSALLIEGMFAEVEPKIQKIQKYYDALADDIKQTKPGKRIKQKLSKFKSVEIGQKAPDFSGPTPDGKTISLKQSLGKVTIVDFWASWCEPCRKENPNVVALYNEFHSKGLNIIGVSLDREGGSAQWKEAIAKDKLAWNHISNLKFWEDPIAKQYNVQSIPSTFILDKNGIIVAKNISGAELKAKISELLAK
ncbi:TlpA disulfide reductase family protein [Flavobacterium terrae]|uniref:Peroxiredoxin n=1 Tax=Flavobacterium terrae TaxID=415425 RepID=A0A1M6H628_9FLAO|nr:TlpA disulfide reductase family protein [Flavobacterium terrae]SHJ17602.1 Peroxiredoxin [Flavobacterium terrae]